MHTVRYCLFAARTVPRSVGIKTTRETWFLFFFLREHEREGQGEGERIFKAECIWILTHWSLKRDRSPTLLTLSFYFPSVLPGTLMRNHRMCWGSSPSGLPLLFRLTEFMIKCSINNAVPIQLTCTFSPWRNTYQMYSAMVESSCSSSPGWLFLLFSVHVLFLKI